MPIELFDVRVLDFEGPASILPIYAILDHGQKLETIAAVYIRVAERLHIPSDSFTIYMFGVPILETNTKTLQEFQAEFELANLDNVFEVRIIPDDFFCNVVIENSDLFGGERRIQAVRVQPLYTNAQLYSEVAKVISSAIYGSDIEKIKVLETGFQIPKTTEPLKWKNIKEKTLVATLSPGSEELMALELGLRASKPIYFIYKFADGRISPINQKMANIYKKIHFDDFYEILDRNKPSGFAIGSVFFNNEIIHPGKLLANNSSKDRPFIVYETGAVVEPVVAAAAGAGSEDESDLFNVMVLANGTWQTLQLPALIKNADYYELLSILLGKRVTLIKSGRFTFDRNERTLLPFIKDELARYGDGSIMLQVEF